MNETETATLNGTGARSITSREARDGLNVLINLPPTLRSLTAGQAVVEVHAKTVREALRQLALAHPGLEAKLCDGAGNPRRFTHITLNRADIRFLDNLDTVLGEDAELDIRVSTGRAR